MIEIEVIKQTKISVPSDAIQEILRKHFNAPEDAWIEFNIIDYGDSLGGATITWSVEADPESHEAFSEQVNGR